MTDTGASVNKDAFPWRNRIIGFDVKPADQFQANPDNWRKHPREQREAVRGSLNELGWIDTVIENVRTGNLIDGHERVWQALDNDNADVPYIQVDLTEQEEKLALAILDPLTGMATTDAENLDRLLQDVQTADEDLQQLIANMAEDAGLDWLGDEPAEDPGAQVDRAAELQEKWQVERGQVWEIASQSVAGECHRLMCGDATDEGNVGELMDGVRADAVITDPPYGVNFVRNKFIFDGRAHQIADRHESIEGDDRRGSEQRHFIENVFLVVRAHCKNTAAVYCWSAPLLEGYQTLLGLNDAGVHVQSQLIWNKGHLSLGQADYQWQHEQAWYGWFHGKNHLWLGGRNQVTVFEISRVSSAKQKHPTEKNPELIAIWVTNSVQHAGVVSDPFLGSGTTMVAAEQTGRLCYGMEISEKYCAVALERLAGMGLDCRLAEESPTL